MKTYNFTLSDVGGCFPSQTNLAFPQSHEQTAA